MRANKILVIEDNDDDVIIIKRGLKKGKIANEIHRVVNGKEAVDYFFSEQHIEIDIILLDLNMEVMNGFEFLQKRKEIPELFLIPTIVLTSSDRKEDIEKAYELGANSYVEKPLDPKEFISTILSIQDYWLYISKKP